MAIVARSTDQELLTAIAELAEYLHEDPVATAFNVGNSFFTAAEAWKTRSPGTLEEIHDYYRETPSLLHQLVFANYGIPHELELLNRLPRMFPGGSILDLGAGIGSALLVLPHCARTHADLGGPLLQYARWRYRRRGQRVRVVQLENDYARNDPYETFDGVICTEVLEHVPEPEILVAQLAKLVRPGGTLLATVSFDDVNGTVPQHLNVDRWTDDAFTAQVFPAHGFEALGEDLYRRI